MRRGSNPLDAGWPAAGSSGSALGAAFCRCCFICSAITALAASAPARVIQPGVHALGRGRCADQQVFACAQRKARAVLAARSFTHQRCPAAGRSPVHERLQSRAFIALVMPCPPAPARSARLRMSIPMERCGPVPIAVMSGRRMTLSNRPVAWCVTATATFWSRAIR